MKKIASICGVLIFCLSFAGCSIIGNQHSDDLSVIEPPATTEQQETTTSSRRSATQTSSSEKKTTNTKSGFSKSSTKSSTSRQSVTTQSTESTTIQSTTETEATTTTTEPTEPPFTPVYTAEQYFEEFTFYDEVTEEDIEYLFHEPLRQSDEPFPLTIFLHGRGDPVCHTYTGTATPFVLSLIALENKDSAYGCYTLVPCTPLSYEGDWTFAQVTAFKKLLYELIETYNIDESRIYISGVSMGGFMTCRLVSELPDMFAAAIPLSGAQNLSWPGRARDTAFRIYHAATDTIVHVSCSRNLYQQLLNAQHPNVAYVEYPTGAHITPIYTVFEANREEFFSWMFSQRRP